MSTKTQILRVGWIGLGNMGLAMAINLQAYINKHSLPAIHYTNRTLSRGETLKEMGGVPYEEVGKLAGSVDIIFISLSDDSALKSVVEQVLNSGPLDNKIIVDTSTVHPDTSVSAGAKLTEAGGLFIAAPVFGATPVAVRGELLMALAGPNSAIEAINPYLVGTLVRAVIPLGEDISKAGLMKTTGNFITAGLAELLSEAHVFAEKSGLGSEALESLIGQNYGSYALSVSNKLTNGSYVPATNELLKSALHLAIKDVSHGVTTAENLGMRLKIGEMALGHLEDAKNWSNGNGGRKLDSSGVYGIIREEAGLDFETEFVKKRDA